MNRKPTARQLQVLLFLQRFIRERGFPPSFQEICSRFGFRSTNAANDYLRSLERKGLIEVEFMKSRAIKLTPLGETECALTIERTAVTCDGFKFLPVVACACCGVDAVHNGACARCGFALRGAA